MDAKQFQKTALRTANKNPDRGMRLANWGLGLSGEAGEAAELIKKHVFHQHPLDRDALARELGDVLWYVAVLAKEIDASLEDLMEINVLKLQKRYPKDFTPEASINRPSEG